MKSIERFDFNRSVRTARNVKILYEILKFGSKEVLKKVNPAIVVIDAAISVMDMTISYLKYKKELKKNEFLKKKLELVKEEYLVKKEIIEKELSVFEVEIKNLSEEIIYDIKIQKEKMKETYEMILVIKDNLVLLKKFYMQTNDKEMLEKIITLQNLYIDLLLK